MNRFVNSFVKTFLILENKDLSVVFLDNMTRNIALRKKEISRVWKIRPEEKVERRSQEARRSSRAERPTQGTGLSGAQSAKSFHESCARFPLLQ